MSIQRPFERLGQFHLIAAFVLIVVWIVTSERKAATPTPSYHDVSTPSPMYTYISAPSSVLAYVADPIAPPVSLPIPASIPSVPLTAELECHHISYIPSLAELETHSTILVGSEHQVLQFLPQRKGMLIYEPNPDRWDMVAKMVNQQKVTLYSGLFSNRHAFLHINPLSLRIQAYDQRVFDRDLRWLLALNLAHGRYHTLVFSHWQYWCYFVENEPDLLSLFSRVLIVNPENAKCQTTWLACQSW